MHLKSSSPFRRDFSRGTAFCAAAFWGTVASSPAQEVVSVPPRVSLLEIAIS